MDYEKKYKEALELARVAAFNGHQSLMEGIFPELKEPEDERIKKELINYFTKGKEYLSLCSIGKNDILSWLEKQDEHKSNWDINDDWIKTKIIKVLLGCETFLTPEETNECIDWIKSIKQRIGG